MTNFQIFLEILKGVQDIPGYNHPRECSAPIDGTPTEVQPEQRVLWVIMRLQTLAIKVQESAEVPKGEDLQPIAEMTEQPSAAHVFVNASITHNHACDFVTMVRIVITQIVHEAIPREHDRANVEYFVGVRDGCAMLCFRELNQLGD